MTSQQNYTHSRQTNSITPYRASNHSAIPKAHLPYNISIGGNISKCRKHHPKISTNIALGTMTNSEALKYFRSSSKFTLDPVYFLGTRPILEDSMRINDKSISDISHALMKIRALTHLSLRLQGPEAVTEDMLKAVSDNMLGAIAQAIRKLKFLTSITLDFGKCAVYDLTVLEYFLSSLRALPKLNKLTLVVSDIYDMSDEGLLALIKFLRRKQSLSTINLHFEFQSFSDNSLNKLTRVLANRKKLTHLSLVLSKIYECTKSITGYIRDLFTSCTSLTNLTLELPHVIYKDAYQVQDIFPSFKFMKALENLQLSLTSIEGINKHLSGGLFHLTGLKSLYVVFDGVENQRGLNLSGLEALKSLTLGYKDSTVRDEIDLSGPEMSLAACEKLQSLSIIIPTTADTAKRLVGAISLMPNLQELVLTVPDKYDDVMKSLYQALMNLNSLINISLEFQSYGLRKRLSMRMLAQTLRKLRALKSIKLFLRSSEALDEEELTEVCESIKSLDRISSVCIYNLGCKFDGLHINVDERVQGILGSIPTLYELEYDL